MNQHNDHDFQQFRGQFDDAMMPTNAFKAKMEKLLQSESPIEPERLSTVSASPSESPTVISTARRSSPLMVAAAILTVFAVVVASVWVLSGNVLEPDYASAPSGFATTPPDAPGMPGEDVNLTPTLVEGTDDVDWPLGIYDGIAIYHTLPESSPPQGLIRETGAPATPDPSWTDRTLVAIDLKSGERLWEKQESTAEALAYVDGTLVSLQFDMTGYGVVHSRILSGINLHSGEINWQVAVPDSPPGIINSLGWPIVTTQGLIVLPDVGGTIWAWDIETGELAWERAFDPGKGHISEWESNGVSQSTTFRNFAATEWNGQIVIVNEESELQALDPEDGSTISTIHLMSENPESFPTIGGSSLALHSVPGHVVLVRPVASPDGQRSEAVALNPQSGEIVWSQQFEGSIGISSVSEDGSLTINAGAWHENPWYLQLIGRSGYNTNQFYWFNGETGTEILTTEKTTGPFFNYAVTNGDYACIYIEESEVVCYDQLGTRHIIDIPLISWMEFENGVLYIPTEDGLYRVNLP